MFRYLYNPALCLAEQLPPPEMKSTEDSPEIDWLKLFLPISAGVSDSHKVVQKYLQKIIRKKFQNYARSNHLQKALKAV